MRILAVLLIVLGIVALLWGGISYTREKKVLDIGPIEARTKTRETIPLPPILGVVVSTNVANGVWSFGPPLVGLAADARGEPRRDPEPGHVRDGGREAERDARERPHPERERDGAIHPAPARTTHAIRPPRKASSPANATCSPLAGSLARSEAPTRAPTKVPTTTGAASSAFTSPRPQYTYAPAAAVTTTTFPASRSWRRACRLSPEDDSAGP